MSTKSKSGSGRSGITNAFVAMIAGALTPMEALRSMFTSKHEALVERQSEYGFEHIVAGALARNAESEFLGMSYEQAIQGVIIASAMTYGSCKYDDACADYRSDYAMRRQLQYIDAAIVALAKDTSDAGREKLVKILMDYEACSGALQNTYEREQRQKAAKEQGDAGALAQYPVFEDPRRINVVVSGYDDSWVRATFGGYPNG